MAELISFCDRKDSRKKESADTRNIPVQELQRVKIFCAAQKYLKH
jgi:hypothetical protein